jgi:peptide/nickel transport system ATP-binding protein
MVMYAGRIVEEGTVDEVFSNPGHEYTRSLLDALPERSRKGERLKVIPGKVPLLEELPDINSNKEITNDKATTELSADNPEISGCPFASRCERAEEQCRDGFPEKIKISETHVSRCILAAGERLP